MEYLSDEIISSLSTKSAYSDDESEEVKATKSSSNALVRYSVNEDTAVRGLMSDAVRNALGLERQLGKVDAEIVIL